MGQPTVRWQESECDAAVAAAKRDLADSVLSFLKTHNEVWIALGTHSPSAAADTVVAALERLFTESGIELTTTQQQEGEDQFK